MRRHLLLYILPLFLPVQAIAQPYVEGGDTRYLFAQTYAGAGAAWLAPGTTSFHDPDRGDTRSTDLPARLIPRLAIGGTHFWGHADFYISFPLGAFGASSDSTGRLEASLSSGIETGMRLYPWRLEHGRVVPFVGVSWNVMSYAQSTADDEGPTIWWHRAPLHAGASWLTGVGRFDIGGTWYPGTSVLYPTTRTQRDSIHLPEWGAWLNYSFLFDATAMLGAAERRGLLAERERRMEKRGELNSLAIAAGPSAAFPLSSSTHNAVDRPFLDDRVPSGVYPDLAIGFYHHALDAAINLSYRPIRAGSSGYRFGQEMERTALSLEAFKFIGDFHGFVPFVGVSFGHEWRRVIETDSGRIVNDIAEARWAPGIIAGWDIRPTRTEPFLLRTNLRYTPGAELAMTSGRTVAFDHLEINFIQLVVYPGRLFASSDEEGDE